MPYAQSRWTLDPLLPSAAPADFDKALAVFDRKVKKVEAWRKKLKPNLAVKAFTALMDDYEAMHRDLLRLNAFTNLRFLADTQDQAALALMTRLDELIAETQNRVLFFSLWWKALDNVNARRLLKAAGDRRYWLEMVRSFRAYTLSEAEEKIINLKDVSGALALQNLYQTITNKLTFNLIVDGQTKTLTRDALMVYARDANPALREAAYRELYRVYTEHGPVLAQIYGNLARNWRSENLGLRKFKTPIAVRNLANDVPDKVVDTLLDVIARNAGVFQRYFRLKARWLGVERLRRYDLYAPLAKSEKAYAYDAAVGMVLETFTEFSPHVGALARQVFDEGHVDSEVRSGKSTGAFCWSVLPELRPWVLVNYNGKASDVAVLAHEMGHAIHALLAADHSALTFHSALPMAETASVFSEMMLTEKLLAAEPDPAVRRDLLAAALDDAYATVGRQGFFAMWEKEAHEMVKHNATADEMAARYLETLKTQFGDAVTISDEFKWEWVSIPHFYATPFYVYAYSFGQLLVLSLYEMFRHEGQAFKPKYLKILGQGGSAAPARILKQAGIDIASADFWQGGYNVIVGMIDRLEKMEA